MLAVACAACSIIPTCFSPHRTRSGATSSGNEEGLNPQREMSQHQRLNHAKPNNVLVTSMGNRAVMSARERDESAVRRDSKELSLKAATMRFSLLRAARNDAAHAVELQKDRCEKAMLAWVNVAEFAKSVFLEAWQDEKAELAEKKNALASASQLFARVQQELLAEPQPAHDGNAWAREVAGEGSSSCAQGGNEVDDEGVNDGVVEDEGKEMVDV